MSAFGFVEILFSIALLVYGVVTLKSRKKTVLSLYAELLFVLTQSHRQRSKHLFILW